MISYESTAQSANPQVPLFCGQATITEWPGRGPRAGLWDDPDQARDGGAADSAAESVSEGAEASRGSNGHLPTGHTVREEANGQLLGSSDDEGHLQFDGARRVLILSPHPVRALTSASHSREHLRTLSLAQTLVLKFRYYIANVTYEPKCETNVLNSQKVGKTSCPRQGAKAWQTLRWGRGCRV